MIDPDIINILPRDDGWLPPNFPPSALRPRPAETPADVPSQVLRGTSAGLDFQSACRLSRADAPVGAYESVALAANPPASTGNEYRFGSGRSPPFHNPAYQFLKRSEIANTSIDIVCMGFLLLFVLVFAVAIVGTVASVVSFII